MSIIEQLDHVSDGLSRLLTQYKGKPKMEAVLTAYMEQVQDLETAFFELLQLRYISTGVGIQLDIAGKILGEPRNERVDELYRVALKARALINYSEGTPEDLLEVLLALISGQGNPVTQWVQDSDMEDPTTDEYLRVLGASISKSATYSSSGSLSMRSFNPSGIIGSGFRSATIPKLSGDTFDVSGKSWNSNASYPSGVYQNGVLRWTAPANVGVENSFSLELNIADGQDIIFGHTTTNSAFVYFDDVEVDGISNQGRVELVETPAVLNHSSFNVLVPIESHEVAAEIFGMLVQAKSGAHSIDMIYFLTGPTFQFDSGAGWDDGRWAGVLDS